MTDRPATDPPMSRTSSGSMTNWFDAALADLPGPDVAAAAAVRARADDVLRPSGALARLDDIAVHVAAWRRTTTPAVERPAALVFAADHGVAAAGVSAYPSDVTAAMLAAVERGRATINAMARAVGATVTVVDVGVGDPTADFRYRPAMSEQRFDATAARAADAVDALADAGADLLVLGELGIGNTTAAATLPAVLLGGDAADWVGRGTGVDDDGLDRKVAAVGAAVARVGHAIAPLDALREVGGAELAAMAAACVQARRRGVPVVLDGFVCGAAVLPLALAAPGSLDHCIIGHRSAEPGHALLLPHLAGPAGADPLLDLAMRLGEGSGAMAAVPLVRMACAVVVEVPTFDEWFGE